MEQDDGHDVLQVKAIDHIVSWVQLNAISDTSSWTHRTKEGVYEPPADDSQYNKGRCLGVPIASLLFKLLHCLIEALLLMNYWTVSRDGLSIDIFNINYVQYKYRLDAHLRLARPI